MLTGKIAVVTGASKGMGREFTARLIAAGAKVAALARPSSELDQLAQKWGDALLALPCDVRDSAAVTAAIARAADHFGRIDYLINNAAMFHPFAFEEGSDALIEQHVSVNLLGPIWTTRAAIPHLRASQGQVVMISSESVLHPFPMLALYAATKSALEVLTNGLRDELRSEKIRFTILRSGSVSGGSGGAEWSAETQKKFYQKILQTGHAAISGKPASPESMAEALLAILRLPPDISPDLIEVRAAHAGLPAGSAALADAPA